MSRDDRSRPLAALAAGLAVLSLTVGFGAVDLASPWVIHEGTQVSDVGYGTLAGLVIPIGLISQVYRPTRHLAGLQQVGVAALAYFLAGLLAGQRPLLLAGAAVAAATIALAMLHPARGQLLALRRRPSLPLLGLALLACGPGSQYALHMAFNQRDGVLPADAHLGLAHWAALSAAALGALFAALLASLRTSGSTIAASTAGAAILAWALSCLAYPDSAGALGTAWSVLAIIWAITFQLVAHIPGGPRVRSEGDGLASEATGCTPGHRSPG
jgi:hypothetical protein